MKPRDPHESHRAATPLELFFDLVFVIAIAAAAAGLHHALAHGHTTSGLLHFGAAFFMIWWAWMNYSWFASAYDNDDLLFRLLTLTIMGGSSLMAAGIEPFFETNELLFVLIGFLVMRIAMATLWFRVAAHDEDGRRTALTYGSGILLAQLYWVIFVLSGETPATLFWSLFALGMFIELLVPVIAERQGRTNWHLHHMIERYGLLNIIVLGESFLAATMALGKLDSDHASPQLISLAICSLVIVSAMWWLYFAREDRVPSEDLRTAFTWAYGHFLIYAAGAAVGAGLALMADVLLHEAHISIPSARLVIGIPMGIFLLGLWFVEDRHFSRGAGWYVLPGMAVLMMTTGWFLPLEALAALAVVTVWLRPRLSS